jgi:hypothetical protein
MIKISIKWDTVSPFLQTISGILTIEDIDRGNDYSDSTRILTCTVDVKNNPRSTGFGSINDKRWSSAVFDKYKDTIDVMVDSYFRGVLLKESDYVWVDK